MREEGDPYGKGRELRSGLIQLGLMIVTGCLVIAGGLCQASGGSTNQDVAAGLWIVAAVILLSVLLQSPLRRFGRYLIGK